MAKLVISLRGSKELVAVFCLLGQLSGTQSTSRPKETEDIINYVAQLPMTEDTVIKLKKSAKQRIDVSNISDSDVASSIKIPVEIDENSWQKAMHVFKYAFGLKGNPQMPYFIRVGGTALINELKAENAELFKDEADNKKRLSLEKFKSLTIDEKLNEVYRLFIEKEDY